jgi:lysophospholipase L1-like esterase
MLRSKKAINSRLACGALALIFTVLIVAPVLGQRIPKLVLVGDSTVSNSSGDFRGWGNVIGEYFDPAKIEVMNKARGGRSSRTFITEGLWDQVTPLLSKGDIVLIQFGHNDGGSLDKDRARGSLKGVGNETQDVTIEATQKKETIRTFGSYLRTYVTDAKAKGAIVVLVSPVPRNQWKELKVIRAAENYGGWSKAIARETSTYFLDLNEITAAKYEKVGREKVGSDYFTTVDHTHTSLAGALVNAESVIEGLRKIKGLKIDKFVKKR